MISAEETLLLSSVSFSLFGVSSFGLASQVQSPEFRPWYPSARKCQTQDFHCLSFLMETRLKRATVALSRSSGLEVLGLLPLQPPRDPELDLPFSTLMLEDVPEEFL